MKYNIFTLFTLIVISSSQSAISASCSDLRDNLIFIEHELLSSKNNQCSDCKTKLQLEKEYNKALAELVIAQGLFSIGQTIEGNHNAMADLTTSKVRKAKNYMYNFNRSLDKAVMLDEALMVVGNQSVYFNNYAGDNKQNLEVYLHEYCFMPEASYADKSLCQNLKDLKANDNEKYQDYLTTINGILVADDNNEPGIRERSENRAQSFVEYRKKLEIKKDDTEGYLTPSAFKNSPYYIKKLAALELELNTFDRGNQEQKEKIISLAKQLDDIEVNYNGNSPTENDSTAPVLAQIENAVTKNYDRLNVPNLLLTEPIQESFSKSLGQTSSHLKRYEAQLDNDINNQLKDIRTLEIDGKTVASRCGGKYDSACLLNICGADETSTSCQVDSSYGLDAELQKVVNFKRHQSNLSGLTDAQSCLETGNLESKKACLQNHSNYQYDTLKADNGSLLGELKRGVAELERKMINQNSAQPFTTLNLRKALALDALKTQRCLESDRSDIIKCKDISYSLVDSTLLNLGQNGEEILIQMNNNELINLVNDNHSQAQKDSNQRAFLESCKNPSELDRELQNLCYFYKEKNEHRDRIATRDREIEVEINDRFLQLNQGYDDTNYAGIFLKNFGTTFAYEGIAKGVPAYAEYTNTKTQTKFIRNQIAGYDEWFMARNNYLQGYIDNPPTSNFLYTNSGLPFIGSNVTDQANFQGNNTGLVYNQFDTTSFNYTPIPTTTGFSSPVSPVASPTSSPSNTTPNTFGFSF